MNRIPVNALDKLQRDHDYLFELMERIEAVCALRGEASDCRSCDNGRRVVCQGNVQQLVQALIEATLKHHAIEQCYMGDTVPSGHRAAHARAHMAIVERLKAIHIELSDDGNCVTAIDGVGEAMALIRTHIDEYDAPLERYLQLAA